jgi:hypothetical protein
LHLLSPFPPCHCLAWLSAFCPRCPLPPSVRRVGDSGCKKHCRRANYKEARGAANA